MFGARLVLGFVVAAAGCQGFPPIVPCGEIPTGGCPVGRGGTCGDPTCTALYDCKGGEWTRVVACPLHDGGAGGTGGGGSTGGAGGAAGSDGGPDGGPGDASDGDACMMVRIDVTGQTTGCTPDLENPPDCPVQAALGCVETVCSTGCTDFFLCKATSAGPEWFDVAYCTCDGQIVVTQ